MLRPIDYHPLLPHDTIPPPRAPIFTDPYTLASFIRSAQAFPSTLHIHLFFPSSKCPYCDPTQLHQWPCLNPPPSDMYTALATNLLDWERACGLVPTNMEVRLVFDVANIAVAGAYREMWQAGWMPEALGVFMSKMGDLNGKGKVVFVGWDGVSSMVSDQNVLSILNQILRVDAARNILNARETRCYIPMMRNFQKKSAEVLEKSLHVRGDVAMEGKGKEVVWDQNEQMGGDPLLDESLYPEGVFMPDFAMQP